MSLPKKRSLFANALIVASMRWTDRLIGLVSTLILARLLVPADFGVVAMASVLVGMVDVLLDLGVNMALIQNKDADAEDFNTAWTIRLIQSVLVTVLIFIAAPFAADYYRDERVQDVVRLMALTNLIGGFENIGIIAFQKEMSFGRDFQFFFTRRVVGFLVTMTAAVILHSYWAMPIGALAGRLTGVGLSYFMHPFRPRFSLSRLRNLWSFSQWMLLLSIGYYFNAQFDRFLVGRRSSAATMGAYSLADEISAMPSTELLAPLGRVLFPAFVATRHDPAQLRKSYLLALAVQTLVAIPAGVGLASVAEQVVMVLLGEKWRIAIPFMQILGMVYALGALSHAAGYLLVTMGRVRSLAIFIWIQNGLFLLLAGIILPTAAGAEIAMIRLVIGAIGLVLFLAMVLREVPELRIADLIDVAWRPVIAALVMAGVEHFLALPATLPMAASLIISIALGALAYAVTLLGLWYVAGRPSGAETYLLQTLKLGRLLRRSPDGSPIR